MTNYEAHKITHDHIYLVKPGEVHGGVDMYMHPSEVYWFTLTPEKVKSGQDRQVAALLPFFYDISSHYFPVGSELEALFRKIIRENRLQQPFCREQIYALYVQLLCTLARSHQNLLENTDYQQLNN